MCDGVVSRQHLKTSFADPLRAGAWDVYGEVARDAAIKLKWKSCDLINIFRCFEAELSGEF